MAWLPWCLAGLAGLAALLAGALGPMARRAWRLPQVTVAREQKEADALRIGLLGASFIGQVAVVHAADKRRDAVVVAVAARDEARAAGYAARLGVPTWHGGAGAYEALLAREDVDAVYVGLPTRLHLQWASLAMAAGKHVLVEKPLGPNAPSVAALCDQAARAGLVVMEAAHYRFHPAALRARELLLGGAGAPSAVGDLESVSATFFLPSPRAVLSSSWLAGLLGWPPPSDAERLQERVKNLDRWWYCLDEVLWFTGATAARVLSAREGRFSLAARLLLTLPAAGPAGLGGGDAAPRTVNATLEMAQDRLLPLFDWSLAARGAEGTLRFSNVGFPFLWHAIDVRKPGGGGRREQRYGEGETTFEHQLAAFVAEVRAGAAGRRGCGPSALAAAELTLPLVDEILSATGGGSLPFGTDR